jgi:hypothetical protein
VCVVAALAFAVVGTGVPALAQEAPAPAGTTATATSTLDPKAVSVAIDLTRTRRKLDDLERRIAVETAQATSARMALEQVESQITATNGQLEVVKDRLRDRAAFAYVHGSAARQSLLDVARARDLNTAGQYAQAATDVDDQELARLLGLEHDLESQRAERALKLQQISDEQAQLEIDQQQLSVLRSREQALLDAWGAVPVMGDSWLSGPQLAAWYRSTGAVPHLAPGTTIDDLARLYIVEGNAEHVRGDLAFAQSVIETASFSVAAGNNYSGIGVCDSCTGGDTFPTPLDGVRAQIQLLRNYADPDSRAATLANPPSPGLYGADPAKAAALYDSFFLKGKAPLWNVMGNGNWATDPTYARKVVELFARMVAYTVAHPS